MTGASMWTRAVKGEKEKGAVNWQSCTVYGDKTTVALQLVCGQRGGGHEHPLDIQGVIYLLEMCLINTL